MLYKTSFDEPACSMLTLPSALDSTQRTVLVGFADGVVRALLQCSDAWKITARLKPHSGTKHWCMSQPAAAYHKCTLFPYSASWQAHLMLCSHTLVL